MKNLLKSKLFIGAVVAVVVLFIVFLPHTKTTKVNSDLTGVYVVERDRYLLHRVVESSVTQVCTGVSPTKETITEFYFNGSIKAITTIACDGSVAVVEYYSDGATKATYNTTNMGNFFNTGEAKYNKYGQMVERVTTSNGFDTFEEWTYNKEYELTDKFTTNTNKGIKTLERTDYYVDGNLDRYDYNNIEDDVVAAVTCDDTGCKIATIETPDYKVTYNIDDDDYDLQLTGDSATQKIVVNNVSGLNVQTVLEDVDTKVEAVQEADDE